MAHERCSSLRAALEENIMKCGTYSSKDKLAYLNNIYDVDFLVEVCGTNREEPDKKEKSWGQGLTFFSRLD